ncbi:PREDICTED: eukaryotic translation initiation factor 4B3-like [Camelina sativa]|uniref:Eukaryotic translation initiation factor 4B3-like n=1 Tax=Camelina sativa TaxID=90675 RepID=A0ABM0U748_CAMSA|nr:PREDICTED: eukaryotic translation initiation factor 4B3-like [Camelina sativa]
MAAAVSSVWAKPGAWALEAEEHEAELKQQAPSSTGGDSSDFPSLAAAATTKTKKKKGQTISLAEFATYSSAKKAASAAPQTERLTQAELVALPTGPRERSAEELDRSKLGGGFRSYGGSRYGDESSNSRWGSSRVSEDGERRGGGGGFNRESSRDSGPSRADEDDNWGATKKPIAGNGFERRERGGGGGVVGGGFFDSQSKADEVDSWVSTKPSESRRFVSTSGGGGDRFEKRGSFESLSRNRDSQYGGADSDTWGRRREESPGANGVPPPSSGGSRPRLMLQPRTLPVPVVEVVKPEVVKPMSPVTVAVDRPKGANPFGNARPREEVLAEKGQDWKEIDEKLEADKLKDVAAAIDEKSSGKMGFGLGNGRKDDDRTERTWRKSTEQSEERAQEEEAAVEEAKKEDTGEKPDVEEAKKEETGEEPAVEEEDKKEEETEDKN